MVGPVERICSKTKDPTDDDKDQIVMVNGVNVSLPNSVQKVASNHTLIII